MPKFTLILNVLFFAAVNLAHAEDTSSDKLTTIVQRALRYVESAQFKDESFPYIRGEWPVQLKTYLVPNLLGVGKPFSQPVDEPTAFATSSIINLLSEAYLLNSNLSQIPQIIRIGVSSFYLYSENGSFFYYPLVEYKGQLVRGSKVKEYAPKYLRGLLNVPPDADTTSVSQLALSYDFQINDKGAQAEYKIPTEVLLKFDLYRDYNRNAHSYNRWLGFTRTNAFLTWHWDEKKSNLLDSIRDKPDKGTRIAFYKNDVDCIVNANVLRLLEVTKNQNHPGYEPSCKFLNEIILKEKQKYCAAYYPNSYAVTHAISNIYKAGAQCLQPSRRKILEFVTQNQTDEGYWANEEGIGREDRIQSTALALATLLNYIDFNDRQYVSVVSRGIAYLIRNQKNKKSDLTYWPGEVFFSGGVQSRNTVLWRSSSYTTSLVILVLTKADLYLNGAPK